MHKYTKLLLFLLILASCKATTMSAKFGSMLYKNITDKVTLLKQFKDPKASIRILQFSDSPTQGKIIFGRGKTYYVFGYQQTTEKDKENTPW